MVLERQIKLMVFVDHYYPGLKSGGPAVSIKNIIETLPEKIETYIITFDRDLGDKTAYMGVIKNKWLDGGNYKIKYVPPSLKRIVETYLSIKTVSPDIIYMNSFFSKKFTLPVLFLKKFGVISGFPIIIAPRGELCDGALNIKRKKKALFVKIYNFMGMQRKLYWHSTSSEETECIKNQLSASVKLFYAPNVIKIPKTNLYESKVKNKGRIRIIYFSRITEKKNLFFALSLLKNLKGAIHFDIYGPIEDPKYWELCAKIMKQLPPHIKTDYKGILDYDNIESTLAKYHVLLFPTKSENFGHVIVESLINGLPVIISDQTPWKRLKEQGIGWDLSLGEKMAFCDVIQTMIDMGQDEYKAMVDSVKKYREYILKEFTSGETFINMLSKTLIDSSDNM